MIYNTLMKKIIISIIIIFPIILMPNCQPQKRGVIKQTKNPVVIKVWFHSGQGVEREVLIKQITDFNTKHTNIVVEPVLLPEGAYNELVKAAAIMGNLPDLLDFDGPNLYNYAWAGHLVPLDDYIDRKLKEDLLPSIIAQGTYNGKLYSLGQMESGLSLWGNKSLLEKAGIRVPRSIHEAWTQNEFLDVLAKLKTLPEVEFPIDFKIGSLPEWFTYGFSPIIQSFGGDLIDRTNFKSADGILNGPETVSALKFFQSLFRKGFAETKPDKDDAFYAKKTVALAYDGHWMWDVYKQGLKDDLVLLPMPKFGNKTVTGMGSWCWGITSTSRYPEAAWEFLKYLMEPEQIITMVSANGGIPSRKSALDLSENYKKYGELRIFAEQLTAGIAIPRPNTPAYPFISHSFFEAVNNIINGADVQQELNRAVKEIDQFIIENNAYPYE